MEKTIILRISTPNRLEHYIFSETTISKADRIFPINEEIPLTQKDLELFTKTITEFVNDTTLIVKEFNIDHDFKVKIWKDNGDSYGTNYTSALVLVDDESIIEIDEPWCHSTVKALEGSSQQFIFKIDLDPNDLFQNCDYASNLSSIRDYARSNIVIGVYLKNNEAKLYECFMAYRL